MCSATSEGIGAIGEALRRFVADVDADSVPLTQVGELWDQLAGIERLAAAGKTLLARRVEESRVWARSGYASAAEYLAVRSGEAIGIARAQLATSKRLVELGATASALRSGSLSGAQAAAIVDAASVDGSAQAGLLRSAKVASVAELRAEVARVKAAAHPDPEAAHRRIHSARRLRSYCDAEGVWNLVARGTTDDGARILAGLAPFIDDAFHVARIEGRHEPREAYAFDALVAMTDQVDRVDRVDRPDGARPDGARPDGARPDGARPDVERGQGGGGSVEQRPGRPPLRPRHLALLRVDVEALVRGSVAADERCEITGVGSVPVRTARAMLGDAVLKLVITRGTDVASIVHLGRGPTAAQRVALLWASPGCSVAGCDKTRVEIDHRVPWADTRHTLLGELDPLCHHHHSLKTRSNWSLVEGQGKRTMVPPDDLRNPAKGPPALPGIRAAATAGAPGGVRGGGP